MGDAAHLGADDHAEARLGVGVGGVPVGDADDLRGGQAQHVQVPLDAQVEGLPALPPEDVGDQGLAGKGEVVGPGRRQGVAGGDHEQPGGGGQMGGLQPGLIEDEALIDEDHVQPVGAQPLQQLRGAVPGSLQLQVGDGGPQGGAGVLPGAAEVQKVLQPHRQVPGALVERAPDGGHAGAVLPGQGGEQRIALLPRGGELHRAGGAGEQPHPQVLFQTGDVLADGLLAEIEQAGGHGEVQRLRQGEKASDLVLVQQGGTSSGPAAGRDTEISYPFSERNGIEKRKKESGTAGKVEKMRGVIERTNILIEKWNHREAGRGEPWDRKIGRFTTYG